MNCTSAVKVMPGKGDDGGGHAHEAKLGEQLRLDGGECIKIGLPGKLILSKRKGLREVLFSWK